MCQSLVTRRAFVHWKFPRGVHRQILAYGVGRGGGWLGCLIQIKKNILSFSSHVYCTIENVFWACKELIRNVSQLQLCQRQSSGTRPCLGYHGHLHDKHAWQSRCNQGEHSLLIHNLISSVLYIFKFLECKTSRKFHGLFDCPNFRSMSKSKKTKGMIEKAASVDTVCRYLVVKARFLRSVINKFAS